MVGGRKASLACRLQRGGRGEKKISANGEKAEEQARL